MKKIVFLGLLAGFLALIGCTDGNGDGDVPLFTKTFTEIKWTEWDEVNNKEVEKGWFEEGNEGWDRWMFNYENEPFDLSSAFTQDKVYVIKYIFKSDIDIDKLNLCFRNKNDATEYTAYKNVLNNINKNIKYSVQVFLIPNDKASGVAPKDIVLYFGINNRDVDTPATLSFYEFSCKPEPKKEVGGLDKWTISETEFDVVMGTFAETVTFDGKNALHLRPAYNLSSYGDNLLQYDLEDYEGKEITITMSMDIYLKKAARIAWQINSRTPYYPVVCGVVAPDPNHSELKSGPAYSANEWHSITGTYTYTVTTDNTGGWTSGRLIYLSGMQIEGAEAYLANASITITEP
jgi:hypothetical protein